MSRCTRQEAHLVYSSSTPLGAHAVENSAAFHEMVVTSTLGTLIANHTVVRGSYLPTLGAAQGLYLRETLPLDRLQPSLTVFYTMTLIPSGLVAVVVS